MKLITLAEFQFPSGTRKYSFEGVRSPAAFYAPKIKNMGRVDYRLSRESSIFQVGDINMEMLNVDKEFSILRAQTSFANVRALIKFGDEESGLAGLKTLFDGNIAGWNFQTNTVGFRLTDRRFGRFRYVLPTVFRVLNDTDFPNMPENLVRGELIPIIYGRLVSTVDQPIGQVPAFLVDPAVDQEKYRYVLCQHEIRSLVKLYRYGIEIPVTSATVVFSGGNTYLDFNGDVRAFGDFFARDWGKRLVSTDLIHEWLFTEGTGASVNDTAGSADGTLQNDYEWLVSPHPEEGGPSFVNMADNGWISFGTPSTILNLVGDFTLSFWFERVYNPLDAGDEETIFDCGEVLNTKGWRFFIASTDAAVGPGAYHFRTNTSGANQETISNMAGKGWQQEFVGEFQNITIRKLSGIVSIFRGRSEITTANFPGTGGYFSQPTHTDAVPSDQTVKFSDTGTKQFQGGLLNLRIWDRALTDQEIIRLQGVPFTDLLRTDENEITADVEGIMDSGNTEVASAAVNAGGSGYAVNNILTVVGGTGTAATLRVTSVSSGAVTGVSVETPGSYTVDPSNPVSVTGGAGSGATFNLTMTSGTLITNPALQQKDLLERIGVTAGEINSTAFSNAATRADALGYEGAGALLDKDMTFEEAIGQISRSFDMPLMFDIDGKYATAIMHDYEEPSPILHLSDVLHISKDSFSQSGHQRPISSVRYSHLWQWIDQRFENQIELTDSGEVTALGQDIRDPSNLDLFWIRDDIIAEALATARIAYAKENRFFSSFQLPIRLFDQLILAQLFQLTHHQGIASDGNGYQQAWHRVLGLSFDLNANHPKLFVQAFALLDSEVPA